MRYIGLLLLLVVFSCKPSKVYIETHSTDTIYKKEILKITPASLNTIKVDDPCDDLGNLKPFNYEVETPSGSLNVKTEGNKIVVEEKKDSIINKETIDKSVSVDTSDRLEIKYRVPSWAWYSIIGNILLLAWVFKRFIPGI